MRKKPTADRAAAQLAAVQRAGADLARVADAMERGEPLPADLAKWLANALRPIAGTLRGCEEGALGALAENCGRLLIGRLGLQAQRGKARVGGGDAKDDVNLAIQVNFADESHESFFRGCGDALGLSADAMRGRAKCGQADLDEQSRKLEEEGLDPGLEPWNLPQRCAKS